MSPKHESVPSGRLYRVGKDWYVDAALLSRVARRLVVEPMAGGYQILAPAGLVRCALAQGLALPGQTGALYRCQSQRADQDLGGRLRNLATSLGDSTLGGEWDAWPGEPVTASCGCHSCGTGGACGGSAIHSAETTAPSASTTSLAERLIVSEALGTVAARTLADGIVEVHKASQPTPEWACGRYHECIGSILRFPDLEAADPIARVHFKMGRAEITWGVTLDRQRHTMLAEILALVGRQLGQLVRSGAVHPSPPPRTTPGFSAWESVAALATQQAPCKVCPYRLGTNLRCSACRKFLLDDGRQPSADQRHAVTKILGEQTELHTHPYETRRALGRAIAESHAANPHPPLTDAFFVRLERDVLTAAAAFQLHESILQALLETAELTPLDPAIAVSAAAKRAA